MSEDRLIGQFDVTLSEDLVKDVQTTGRPIKTEIWEQGEGKRGLVGCIFVDKNEQDVVRLRVTVFNQTGEGTAEESSGSSAAVSSSAGPTTEQSASESQTEHSGAIPLPNEVADQSTQAAQQMDEKLQQTEKLVQGEQFSQTEKVAQDQKHIQTDAAASAGKTTQTKVRTYGDSAAQTKVRTYGDNAVQTKVCTYGDSASQTKIRTYGDSAVQTKIRTYGDSAVQTTQKKMSERFMQTEMKVLCEGIAQTDIKKFSSAALQTDPKPVRAFGLQTDQWIGTHQCLQACPDLVESAFQTDPKPTRISVVQTVIDTDEKFMQTENPIAEKAIQTRVLTNVKMQQTDPPPCNSMQIQTDNPPLVSTDMQTTRDYLVDLPCQTEDVIVIDPEEQCENDSQTDFVRVIDPRNETSIECQTEPCKVIYPDQYADSDLQTDDVKIINPEEMFENEVQTDDVHIRDPECQAEIEIQTDDVAFKEPLDTVEAEAQTNLVWIFGLTQAPEPEIPEENVESREAQKGSIVDVSHIPEGGDIPQGGDVPQEAKEVEEVKHSMESNIIQGGPLSAADAAVPEGTDISQDQDTQKGIQTDPVTIIIGDSSFLVNKLKVYAQREMRFMEGNRRRGGPRTRGRGRGRGAMAAGPPPLTQAIDMPAADGYDKDMPVLNAESTPRGTVYRRTPMSAPPATRRPFTGLRHRTSPQDLNEICKAPEKKGRFNCPFCTTVFNDSAALYKHLREEHGSPRASNRRRRRKGTILIAEDGSLITDDGTIEIPPLKKDVPLGPIRANNIVKSQSAILHEQHMAKMRALANTETLKKAELGRTDGGLLDKVVHNGTSAATESIQITENPPVGQRAFSCPFCPKLFTKSSALYVHLQDTHKAVKQSKPAKPKSTDLGDGEELVEEYEDGTELVHEEEIELVVPADAAEMKAEELGTEEGEIPLEETNPKVEEGEVQFEETEEGEVHLEHYDDGEVHLLGEHEEVVTEEIVEEEIIEETTEEGEIPLEEVEIAQEVVEHQIEIVPESDIQEEEVEVPEETVVTKIEPEPEKEPEPEMEPEEPQQTTRPRGKVRTRGGSHSQRGGAVERGTKRRRSAPEDDDEEMPKLTRVTRRMVQLESPTRSTRRGPKILSPAKRGRR